MPSATLIFVRLLLSDVLNFTPPLNRYHHHYISVSPDALATLMKRAQNPHYSE